MSVLNPLKVVITNYPEGHSEEVSAPNHPQNESMGRRNLPSVQSFILNVMILWKTHQANILDWPQEKKFV